MSTRKSAVEMAEFWAREARHGLRQPPPMTDANGNPAEPLPTAEPEQDH